ncbi:bifunctional glycosyltransferase family 2/GtrA family protein [Luteimicrobium subarcticum]|uniref:dolichyl-phosphate beta-glucosyltransferase n=1 Tax=Luteimicrobium subarcticum TaxID=620910 RepID=A0A2M8WSH1_9MICO|nr:bifunctional glycosyltransferase family 2/GtrA family protein [Luteimicrobium subarcticum]PJI93891.1 glycosyltransferase involved in cell wall biosynthesis [Luteimicrobium subarcticum]
MTTTQLPRPAGRATGHAHGVNGTPARAPLPAPAPVRPGDGTTTALDLVIPVYNEGHTLEASVRRVHAYVTTQLPFRTRITVADNASTDDTLAVARRLEQELPGVRVVHLDAKGRGRALHEAWWSSDASVLAYMDVDLSTDLAALLPLVAPLLSGHSEVAIGSRLQRGSRVERGPKRELISRCYNLILRGTLAAKFSDAQCGFKAIRADAAHQLLPLVEDTGWFFDTELLVLAERAGLRIHEVPVDWVDDPDSRVDIVATATADLKGVWRLLRDLGAGRIPLDEVRAAVPSRLSGPAPSGRRLLDQVVRFAVVGLACTAAYALLYLLLTRPVGAQWANFLALLATAVLNTGLNRRHTFGVRGPGGALRHHAQGLAVFGLGWALTAGSLAALHAAAPTVGHGVELVVLMVANLAATLLRFLLFRSWVFRPQRDSDHTTEGTLR